MKSVTVLITGQQDKNFLSTLKEDLTRFLAAQYPTDQIEASSLRGAGMATVIRDESTFPFRESFTVTMFPRPSKTLSTTDSS
jgi:hypothetical protein